MKLKKLILVCILIHTNTIKAQTRSEMVDNSTLMAINLPSEAIHGQKIFNVALAKTTLEMESGSYQVNISDVEVLTFINTSGMKEDSKKWIKEAMQSLKNNKYEIFPSDRDSSLSWLPKDGLYYLMYSSSGKKKPTVYFGRADKLPDIYRCMYLPSANSVFPTAAINNPLTSIKSSQNTEKINPVVSITSTEKMPPELIGNWGNVAGANVNWRDESTGYMLISGVSKGYGLELKPDGTFLHTTVVTSGRPNYQVFISTTGNWSENGNQLIFKPQDRHYRKWENEIIMIDEHSVPDPYTLFWMIKTNEITGMRCLYIKYDLQLDKWNELCKE